MARKFSYRGYAIEGLTAMTLEDFIRLVPAKQRRSLSRMGGQMRTFLEKFRAHKKIGKPTRTHFRSMVVLPEMVDQHILVYDGKTFVDILIAPDMLGHRLGEFAITTKLVKHSGPGIGATRGSKTVELK